MGIFSNLFKKNKKNDRKINIDEAFSKVYSKMGQIDGVGDSKKLERYILDSCEQIVAATKEVEKQKTEYNIVTAYLNDIKAFDNLSETKAAELKNTAGRILEIEKAIEASKEIHRQITEDQKIVIAGEEDMMPDIINRMKDNERIVSSIKKEMNQLEGEKTRWEMERESIADQKVLLRKLSVVLFCSFSVLLLLLLVIAATTKADITTWLLVILFACTCLGVGIFVKQNDVKKRGNKSVYYLNSVITQLNVVRLKYVNFANALDATKEKYQVRSAAELEFVWGQYMETIRDQERFTKQNDDLEVYTARLTRILATIDLHDQRIWNTQVKALYDPEAMYEVRQRLVERRSKIRDRIDKDTKMVQNERNEIDRLMRTQEHYLPEILEIIKSVDKLCGTTPQARA
ncbi:MAG: hypothetical protein HUJ70_04030 [Pseudobutyrivibrio sp.]|nr:hypothetical protein [Pseudobutyrivibrio sp.]